MYSESDLDAAVGGGVLSAEAADAFRAFVARSHATQGADEESFRLLTGFNDIFVAIALILVFGAAMARTLSLAALVIGTLLLLLSVSWQTGRRMLVGRLPLSLQAVLPQAT